MMFSNPLFWSSYFERDKVINISLQQVLKVFFEYSMQNKELSHRKKKMDMKVDYAQLPAGPSLWPISEFLVPAI